MGDILQMTLVCLLTLLCRADAVVSLRCWQCIADNCDMDPSDNYKATERECLPGSFCQKVLYTDRYNNKTNPVSIVKSCSTRCEPKDNFDNCTWSKRGCVKRLCCNNTDFCNDGFRVSFLPHGSPLYSTVILILCVVCGTRMMVSVL